MIDNPASGAPLTMDQVQALVTDWNAKKKAADAATLAEREARELLVSSVFPELTEGAGNKAEIGFNMILQVTHPINRKLDVALFDSMKANIPADIIDSVIRYKPEVVVGAWKTLPMSAKKLLAEAVTESPGSPQVKIVPKKKPGEGKENE